MRGILGAIAQTPAFISFHDTDGTLLWANRISFDLPDDIIGQPSDILIFDEDRPRWHAAFRRAVFHRETVEYRVRIKVDSPPGFAVISGRMGPVLKGDKVQMVAIVCYDATFREESNKLARFVVSDLGRQVIAYLMESGTQRGAAIGVAVGETSGKHQASTKLRLLLNDMKERGILEKVGSGYKISEEFQPMAMDLLL